MTSQFPQRYPKIVNVRSSVDWLIWVNKLYLQDP